MYGAAASGVINKRRHGILDSRDKALKIAGFAGERKAEDPVLIEIEALSSVADFLVICGGDSERQVKAISSSVLEGLKEHGERPLGVEGFEAGRWVLMDYGDVVLHVFLTRLRGFYDLEGLWADAPRVIAESAARETDDETAAGGGPFVEGRGRG